AQVADAGQYAAIATNSYGSVTSTVAVIIIDLRPYVLTQPDDVTVSPGATTAFVVSASGPSLNYAWFHNDALIPDAASPVFTISEAVPGNQGSYYVVITNYAGSATSRVASLSFNSTALSILTPPQNVTAAEGRSASFSALAAGIQPIGYQWLLENVPIPNETSETLSFANVSRTNSGVYRVVVTNAYLTLTSVPAVLTVVGEPTLSISAQGTDLLLTCYGDPGRVHRLLGSTN